MREWGGRACRGQVVWAGGKETTRKPRGRGGIQGRGSEALGDEREGCLGRGRGRGSFGAPLLPPPIQGLELFLQTSLPPARQKPRVKVLEMSEVGLALFGRARRGAGGGIRWRKQFCLEESGIKGYQAAQKRAGRTHHRSHRTEQRATPEKEEGVGRAAGPEDRPRVGHDRMDKIG